MNDEDQFEQRLRRQRVKLIPSVWRAEILQATERASVTGESRIPPRSLRATINQQLATIFWPHPKAWAGLAAAWLLILTLQFVSRDRTARVARISPPPSPEMLLVLRQQKLVLAELVEPPETRAAERPKTVPPRPHSQRQSQIRTA